MKNMESLNKSIRHAYETVPFYKELLEEEECLEIEKLPIVDKQQMIESGRSMLSTRYMGQYLTKQLKWTRTSGSSGMIHEIFWNKVDERKSMMGLWFLRWKYYKVSPAQKLCFFFPADINDEECMETDRVLAISRKSLFDGTFIEAYQHIKQYKPEWMILQPGVAAMLCDMAEQYGIWEGVKYIEFTGEYLPETVRKRVKNTFHCATANQYGTKEVNSIAYECPEGNMHVMSDNVYLENEGCKLYVTSLNNYAMPFVRYQLDDRGQIRRHVQCRCGRCSDMLEIYEGRQNDVVKRPDGSVIHAYALMQSVHYINYQYDGCIIQYKIVQEDYDRFTYLIVLGEECPEELKRTISEKLQHDLQVRIGKECTCDVIYKKNILPEEETGKCKVFVSNVG